MSHSGAFSIRYAIGESQRFFLRLPQQQPQRMSAAKKKEGRDIARSRGLYALVGGCRNVHSLFPQDRYRDTVSRLSFDAHATGTFLMLFFVNAGKGCGLSHECCGEGRRWGNQTQDGNS